MGPPVRRPRCAREEAVAAAIHVELHGRGEPLVLVHGLGGTGAAIWKQLIGPLADEYAVAVYDLRGSGRSAVVPGPATIDDHADDLQELLELLEFDRVRFVGHSLGGSIV